MLQVEICFRLERMCEQQNLLLAKQLASQVQRSRRALREAVWNADHRMAGPVRQRLVTSDEQIEITERLVNLLHHPHPEAIRLDEFHRRDEVPGANLVGPSALL